ncbi:MAG: hypothetical protein K0S99_2197, partial [Thermomicrobiales bacterium]|nr:hypothetical protein [Thermomicrobiales bacterium]
VSTQGSTPPVVGQIGVAHPPPRAWKAERAPAQTRHAETGPPGVSGDALALIAAMNPYPCGDSGDPRRACTCAAGAIGRYQKRYPAHRHCGCSASPHEREVEANIDANAASGKVQRRAKDHFLCACEYTKLERIGGRVRGESRNDPDGVAHTGKCSGSLSNQCERCSGPEASQLAWWVTTTRSRSRATVWLSALCPNRPLRCQRLRWRIRLI